MKSQKPSSARTRGVLLACLAGSCLLLSACAAPRVVDYTAFRAAKPASILVLPPINETVEVQATTSVYAQTSQPLAEAGYYVLPVALVNESFHQNGLTEAEDIHAVPLDKLRDTFGADAVLYMTIKRYGSSYKILSSETVVQAQARLVDARTGTQLWEGSALASSEEGKNQNSGGLIGLLVTAVIQQIINTTTDQSHPIARTANHRLLSHNTPGGLLPGPRRPVAKQP